LTIGSESVLVTNGSRRESERPITLLKRSQVMTTLSDYQRTFFKEQAAGNIFLRLLLMSFSRRSNVLLQFSSTGSITIVAFCLSSYIFLIKYRLLLLPMYPSFFTDFLSSASHLGFPFLSLPGQYLKLQLFSKHLSPGPGYLNEKVA
jgi:hypothetical protein